LTAVTQGVLSAPDRHPKLAAQLTDLHRRVRDYARAAICCGTMPVITVGLKDGVAEEFGPAELDARALKMMWIPEYRRYRRVEAIRRR
jgi:hypothetical protein